MNLLDIVARVQRDLGRQWDTAGNEYLIGQLLDAYRDIYNNCNWSFFLKEGKIHLYAHKSLTVSSWTAGTLTMVPDEAISATESTTYTNQKCYVPADSNSFRAATVTAGVAGAAAVVLDMAPVTAPVADDTMNLYVSDYALPADCAYNKEISIIDNAQGIRLTKIAEPTFSKGTAANRFDIGEPICYFAKSRDYITATTNYNYIQFYPTLSVTEKYLTIWYYRKPFANFDTFVYSGGSGTSALLLEIPDEFSHLLYWACLEKAYFKLNDARAGYAMQKGLDILRELRGRNNGDEAMERIISEYPPTGEATTEWFWPNTINVRVVT